MEGRDDLGGFLRGFGCWVIFDGTLKISNCFALKCIPVNVSNKNMGLGIVWVKHYIALRLGFRECWGMTKNILTSYSILTRHSKFTFLLLSKNVYERKLFTSESGSTSHINTPLNLKLTSRFLLFPTNNVAIHAFLYRI